jgi:hypothetical protein
VWRQPNYGVLGADKHSFYPREPPISAADGAKIQAE